MAQPSRATVTIDGNAFKAITPISALQPNMTATGMPAMASVSEPDPAAVSED